MDVLNFREVLTKKPFLQITSERPLESQRVVDKATAIEYDNTDKATYTVLSQDEMLRQYYPSGHKINNELLYPDIWKQDPDTKKWYMQKITRCALAFQQVITTKHIIHLIGNDVQFELSDDDNASKEDASIEKPADMEGNLFDLGDNADIHLLTIFKKGWLSLDMEMRMYESVRSFMITSECAVVGYFDHGQPSFRALSYLNGDKLYPHYDSITGKLTLFARRYNDYDEDGNAMTEWVEVWDEKYFYRFKRSSPETSTVAKIKEFFGLNGFSLVSEPTEHKFNTVPVAYCRNDEGPCWLSAQDTIEKFEEALSYFFENNKAFAFPILVVTGEGVELQGDTNGAVKAISIDSSDGDAHFLDHNDVSASYNTLLTKFYDLIYEQSFTVKPPELKSGDLPGVALKLLYSPAIERAIQDAQRLKPFLDTLVYLVKFSWGLKENCQADLLNLGINSWIEPYVHQNDTELTTNLSMAVQNNILSIRTASERLSKYAKNDEYERIVRQMKEKMLLEVEKSNLITTHAADEEIRKSEIISNNGGQDVNTGYGGGNGHVRETDENGNHPDENNWEKFNQQRF